jgi:DNA-binding transcriptional ArsR family regulator
LLVRGFRERLKNIIESMVGRVVTPGDVVAATGLPRYEVLATFHVLEALGIIELVNEKGNYRVYKLSGLGLKLLKALESAEGLEIDVVTTSGEVAEAGS